MGYPYIYMYLVCVFHASCSCTSVHGKPQREKEGKFPKGNKKLREEFKADLKMTFYMRYGKALHIHDLQNQLWSSSCDEEEKKYYKHKMLRGLNMDIRESLGNYCLLLQAFQLHAQNSGEDQMTNEAEAFSNEHKV